MSIYVVTAFHGETSEKVGEFMDAVKLALAMWELGLQRPEFDFIQVKEMPMQEISEVLPVTAEMDEESARRASYDEDYLSAWAALFGAK